jgi:hypothetical protein
MGAEIGDSTGKRRSNPDKKRRHVGAFLSFAFECESSEIAVLPQAQSTAALSPATPIRFGLKPHHFTAVGQGTALLFATLGPLVDRRRLHRFFLVIATRDVFFRNEFKRHDYTYRINVVGPP